MVKSSKHALFTKSTTRTYTCVQGILGAYQFTLSQVQLYGPTNFSSFLDRAITMASQPMNQQNQAYYILLVITVSGAA